MISLEVIEDVLKAIDTIPGEKGAILNGKTGTMFEKDVEYAKLKSINKAVVDGLGLSEILDVIKYQNLLAANTFAPLTSTDIERRFSTYKRLLNDRRHSFTVDHLEMHVIVNYNSTFFIKTNTDNTNSVM